VSSHVTLNIYVMISISWLGLALFLGLSKGSNPGFSGASWLVKYDTPLTIGCRRQQSIERESGGGPLSSDNTQCREEQGFCFSLGRRRYRRSSRPGPGTSRSLYTLVFSSLAALIRFRN
jgi:hypothetical protein